MRAALAERVRLIVWQTRDLSHDVKPACHRWCSSTSTFHGSYPFHRRQLEEGRLRDLRDPNPGEDEPEQ